MKENLEKEKCFRTMDESFENFIAYLIELLKEKYNDTLHVPEDESESKRSFRDGLNLAYYDVLDLIQSQLEAFGYDTKPFGVIVPELGKKADI